MSGPADPILRTLMERIEALERDNTEMRGQVRRAHAAAHHRDAAWMCERCQDILMIRDMDTGGLRLQYKSLNIRVKPAEGTEIRTTCKNCGHENIRVV